MKALEKLNKTENYGALTVRRFALWWLNNRPISPPSDCLSRVGGLTGMVLYREGPFQVQLFTTIDRTDIPSHTHPNVDSIEMHLSGVVELSVRGDPMKDRESFDGFLTVEHNDDHYGYMENGSFFSFQKWLNNKPLASVHLDWSGAPVDEPHAEELRA